MLKKVISIFLFLSFSTLVFSNEGKLITWAVGHNPPRIMIDDKGLLQGQGGIQQHILQAGLSHYSHAHEVSSFKRFTEDAEKGRHICSSFLFKTAEREKVMTFSIPWHIDLPPRIIMRKDIHEQIGAPKTLSLRTLLEAKEISGAVQKSRSFSTLDEVIEAIPDNNLEQLEIPIPRFMDMLNAGRIDFTIAYSHLVNFIEKNNGLPEEKLVHVPIEEGFEYAFTYVGCPKNAWGQQVIEAINPVIEAERQKSSYLNLLKMLHSNKVNRDIIDKIYYRDFIQSR
jgi:uncharacterized protein (TIGR02285 family)